MQERERLLLGPVREADSELLFDPRDERGVRVEVRLVQLVFVEVAVHFLFETRRREVGDTLVWVLRTWCKCERLVGVGVWGVAEEDSLLCCFRSFGMV